MPDEKERIREIAHQIWEDVGQPTDQAKLHWEMAQKEVEETAEDRAAAAPDPQKKSAAKPEPLSR